MNFDWTDSATAELQRLHAKGQSASQIAAALGNGLTRNAVIGKIGRLKLVGVRKPGSTIPVVAKAKRLPKARPAPAPIVEPEPAPAVVSATPAPVVETAPAGGVVLFDLKAWSCRFIDGNPASARTLYCGARSVLGKSYCPAHLARCEAPRELRVRRSAGR